MSDDWDFCFAKVNDAVSSIFVDLGIHDDAPNEKRPWLLWIWVTMLAPKPDGLSSNAEAKTLHEIGEALPFSLVVSRVDSVDTHTINGITIELARLADENGGRYHGWECAVTKGAADTVSPVT